MFSVHGLLDVAKTGSWQFSDDDKLSDMIISCKRLLNSGTLSKQDFDRIRVLVNRMESAQEAQYAVK